MGHRPGANLLDSCPAILASCRVKQPPGARLVKIYLISPTHYQPDGRLVKSIQYWTSAITLPYLKSLTPREHEVVFTDELMHDVDLNSDADLIGITAMGPQIARAYDLGDLFRRRGKKVVMG